LPLEVCRWLDKGYSLEAFINWVECSSAGTTEQKSIILNKLLPGTHIRLVHGMVELGALLGEFCEKIGEQRDTPDWRLLKWMLGREEIISSSTILHNGYPKGYVFHCIMYLDDALDVICSSRFNLETFYSIYKEICYGEPAQLAQKARVLIASPQNQLHASDTNVKAINNHIEAEGTSPTVLAEAMGNNLKQGTSAKLTHRQIALLYIYQGISLDEALATQVGKENGHKSDTSGRKIMTDHYHPLRGPANNRTGVEGKTAIANMSKAIEGVILHLPEDKRQQAEDELQSLRDKK
jgi:hypothetical protein